MGRIVESIKAAYAEGRTTVSFEFFPAKTAEGVDNLLQRIEDLGYACRPTFVTLTWRSAFKDESLWLKIGATVQRDFGVDVLLHLTCHLPVSDLKRILCAARDAGIQNILALRGDPPIGEDRWRPRPDGFRNAVELVKFIRSEHGDHFCVAVAGYPEVHTESWNDPDLPPSDQVRETDIRRLVEKVEAGADFIITQFFYDVSVFLDFKRRCRRAGIAVPVLPGYLPVQSYNAFKKFTGWCKTAVPRHITERLETLRDDEDQVKSFGVQEAIEVCQRLLAQGAASGERSLHFYTMNLAQAVSQILDALGLKPQRGIRLGLNWRRAAPGSKGHASAENGGLALEEVRPIFWANRQSSYASRTVGWDEYPNGRWGDSRSPAYGELTSYYLAFKRPKVDRRRIWGEPKKAEDVWDVFARFVAGKVEALPWCEQGLTREFSLICSHVQLLNRSGFLTINSQPKVDGKPSTDPEVGWGPPGGYVYQKAYLELFCSPERLAQLLEAFPRYPTLSYHAINAAGDEYRSAGPKCFPRTSPASGAAAANARTAGGAGSATAGAGAAGAGAGAAAALNGASLAALNGNGAAAAGNGATSAVATVSASDAVRTPSPVPPTAAVGPEPVNAVTWGVFPGREVIQPTVVDTASFRAWKGEAFELWLTQWASAYSDANGTGASRRLIEEIHGSYFLVSVVDNDYSEEGDIFAVFKDVIVGGMDATALRERVHELEGDNAALTEKVGVLQHLQRHAAAEMRRLREEAARARSLHDAAVAQLHDLSVQYSLLANK